MTQEDYTLWTGQTIDLDDDQWSKTLALASLRLASFLCLEELPTDDDGNLPLDLQQLLANFMSAMIALQGSTEVVESKHVRNFTINFKTTAVANAFAKIGQQYGDIIEKYSNCDLSVSVERTRRHCCGHWNYGL